MDSLAKGFQSVADKLWGWLHAVINSLPNLVLATFIFSVFWMLGRWAYQMISAIFRRTEFNRTVEHLLAASVKVVVISVGIVLALGVLNLDKTVFSLLAGVGVIGIALGFAFQDLASNFISGIMIAIRAPMRVNDVIKIGSVFGTVIDLRLRDTVVRNFDGQEIFIPNKSFMVEQFANYSTYGRRKISANVNVSYDDDLNGVKEAYLRAVAADEIFQKEPQIMGYLADFADNAIVLRVEAWIKYPGTDPDLAKDRMISAIKKSMDEREFHVAYPSQIARPVEAEENDAKLTTFREREVERGTRM